MPEYTYRAQWLPDDREYLGLCLEFPNVWARGGTPHEAIAATEEKVAEELGHIHAAEDTPPKSLTDHQYSGKFMVRTSSAMHAKLTVEAAEQGVSLNQWVVQKLAARPPVSFDDLF